MALDRAWYNSLVDDDGSGLTGSVWDKEDVNQLMNAIDAEFAAQNAAEGVWTTVLPTVFSAAGSFIGGTLQSSYTRNNKVATILWKLENFSLTAAAGYVGMFMPYPIGTASINMSVLSMCYVANATANTYVTSVLANSTQVVFYPNNKDFPGAVFPAGVSIIIRGQIIHAID